MARRPVGFQADENFITRLDKAVTAHRHRNPEGHTSRSSYIRAATERAMLAATADQSAPVRTRSRPSA